MTWATDAAQLVSNEEFQRRLDNLTPDEAQQLSDHPKDWLLEQGFHVPADVALTVTPSETGQREEFLGLPGLPKFKLCVHAKVVDFCMAHGPGTQP